MGKEKWHKDKPKRSGVFKVRQTVPAYEAGETSSEVSGYAWFDSTRRRWGVLQGSVKAAREHADTSQARYMAGQDKEWARV